MSEVRIRRYEPRDRAAVLRITEESFDGVCLDRNMEDHFGLIASTTWQERKRDGIDHDLRRNAEHAFVAEVDDEVAGFVCTRLYREHSTGHLANLAVARHHQGKGIGTMLTRAALDHFRQCDMRYARVETLEQNVKGQRMYPSFGFKEIGRQVFYLREL